MNTSAFTPLVPGQVIGNITFAAGSPFQPASLKVAAGYTAEHYDPNTDETTYQVIPDKVVLGSAMMDPRQAVNDAMRQGTTFGVHLDDRTSPVALIVAREGAELVVRRVTGFEDAGYTKQVPKPPHGKGGAFEYSVIPGPYDGATLTDLNPAIVAVVTPGQDGHNGYGLALPDAARSAEYHRMTPRERATLGLLPEYSGARIGVGSIHGKTNWWNRESRQGRFHLEVVPTAPGELPKLHKTAADAQAAASSSGEANAVLRASEGYITRPVRMRPVVSDLAFERKFGGPRLATPDELKQATYTTLDKKYLDVEVVELVHGNDVRPYDTNREAVPYDEWERLSRR